MNCYRVCTIKTEQIIKSFKTLEDAIKFRKEYGEDKCKIMYWM